MSPKLVKVLLAVFLAAVGFLLFAHALDNEFIWDDPIVFNQQLPYFDSFSNVFFPPDSIPQFAERYYRPIIVVTYQIDEWLSKPKGKETIEETRRRVYHRTCVLFHTLNVTLVFALGLTLSRLLTRDQNAGIAGAALGALLYAAHPIHVESVSWMAGRSDVVCASFFLTSLIAYARHSIDGRRLWLLAAMVAAFLAMLCKETGVGLILAIPLIEWLNPAGREGGPSRAERRRIEKGARPSSPQHQRLPLPVRWGAIALAFVLYLALRHAGLSAMHVKSPPAADEPLTRLIGAVGWTVGKAVWPFPQSAFVHEIPGGPYFALGLLAPLAWIGFALWNKRRKLGLSLEVVLLWLFFAGAAPSMSIALFRISETPLAERYLYIPTIGLCLALGFLFVRLAGRISAAPKLQSAIAAAAGLAVAVPAGYALVQRGDVWQNNQSFWLDTVAKAPDQGIPHLHLGIYYAEQRSKLEDAAQKASGEEAKRLQAESDKALALSIAESQKAFEVYDDDEGRSKALNNLCTSYIAMADFDKAIESCRKATEVDQRYPSANYNWALALLSKARNMTAGAETQRLIAEAMQHYRLAIDYNPRYYKAHLQLGNLLLQSGQRAEGVRHLQEVLKLAPQSQEAKYAADTLRRYGVN